MQKHTTKYKKFFGLGMDEGGVSEISGQPAHWVHHIDARKMGGTTDPRIEHIENLMAITKDEDEEYGDKKQFKDWLKQIHRAFILDHKPDHKFEYI